MTIIFFLSDNFVWTDERYKQILKYFDKYVKYGKGTVLLENDKFKKEIKNIVTVYSCVNNKIKIKDLIYSTTGELEYIIEKSGLLLIDPKRKREIAYRYIPGDYKGKFKYI